MRELHVGTIAGHKMFRIYDPVIEQHNIMNAVGDVKRALDLAQFYCDCMISGEGVDWKVVNEKILSRYKMSTLIRIKEKAWKLLGEMRH